MSLVSDILRRAARGLPETNGGYDPRSCTTWSPAVDAKILELRTAKVTFRDIADGLGLSSAAVAGRYWRLKNDRKSRA